jgi:hypothetical protein
MALDLGAGLADIRTALAQLPALAAEASVSEQGADLPALPERWTFEDVPDAFLVTNNGTGFGGVDAGMSIRCTPAPLEANVFSGDRGANRLANILDGELKGTGAATMWEDDQVVTIDLTFERPIQLNRMALDAWFATGSSKGKLFQLGHIRMLAGIDGFADDSRVLIDRPDSETYPSWGSPVTYRAGNLDTQAQQLRLILTPRPGTAIYVAELRLWATGNWLAERFRNNPGSANPFPVIHTADIDADSNPEILLGAASGDLVCLDRNGKERWRVQTGSPVHALSSIAASAENGPRRVIAGGDGAVVHAVSPAGETLWTFEIPQYKRKGIVRVILPANLDGTGRQTAVVGAENWRYYALDADGNEQWHYESVHPSTAGLAVDLTDDGKDEVVLGTAYYWWTCVNPDGTKRWGHRTRGGPGANVIAAGNVTGDSAPEVAFGGADTLVQTVTAKGTNLWTFSTGDEVTALQCVDADGDGFDEILAGSLSFNVYCLDGDGTMLWQHDLGAPVTAAQTVTYEGRTVLAAGCADGTVTLVRALDGTVLAGYDAAAPVLALTSTSRTLLVSTGDGRLIALSLTQDREN